MTSEKVRNWSRLTLLIPKHRLSKRYEIQICTIGFEAQLKILRRAERGRPRPIRKPEPWWACRVVPKGWPPILVNADKRGSKSPQPARDPGENQLAGSVVPWTRGW